MKSLIIIGLGRMGIGIARRLLKNGVSLYVYNKTYNKSKELEEEFENCIAIEKLDDIKNIKGKKICWVMLPSGEITDEMIKTLSNILENGDIIIDGGNSKWTNSQKNYTYLRNKGIGFIDAGVSGGVWGEKNGYCIMTGGDLDNYKEIEEYLKVLCKEEGYLYCGETGSGHFVKMVHNAIEYAIMQAYAEGFELLRSFEGLKVKKSDIARLWNNGSVIRSWLVELIYKALKDNDELSDIKAYVEDSGEGRWAVEYAISKGVCCEAIAVSLFRRFRSRQNSPFSEKLLAAMRNQFGGHRVYKDE